MRTIIVVIYVFLFLIFSIPVLFVEWIISKFNKRAADISQLRMVQWGFRCVSFLSGVKLTVKGRENIPSDKPVLYIGNHRSFFDIVVTYQLCPDLTGYISKDGVNKVPILGMIMKRLYCLFLDRKDVKQGFKVILTAIDYVKSGVSICIFPEGSRNKQEDQPASVQPFKEGSFKIAQKTGCPIIPMAITGTDDVFEKHFPWIRRSNVTVTYGEPILISELPKDEQKHVGVYCRSVIQNMLEKELASGK